MLRPVQRHLETFGIQLKCRYAEILEIHIWLRLRAFLNESKVFQLIKHKQSGSFNITRQSPLSLSQTGSTSNKSWNTPCSTTFFITSRLSVLSRSSDVSQFL